MLTKPSQDYPLIPISNEVLFPKITIPVVFKSPRARATLDQALSGERLAVLVLRKRKNEKSVVLEDFYQIGTLARIKEFQKLPDGSTMAAVEGLARVKIDKLIKKNLSLTCQVREVVEKVEMNLELEGLLHNLEDYFKKCVSLGISIPFEIFSSIFSSSAPYTKVDLIAFGLSLEASEKQKVLESFEFKPRLKLVSDLARHKLKVLQVAKGIEKKTAQGLNKVQKEVILHEQLKVIQKELGQGERADFLEIKEKIEQAGMPEEAKKIAEKELKRLNDLPSFSPEVSYIRNYLDWLVSLPWNKISHNKIDIKKAKKILNQEHYGLDEVKERILEHLAVCQLTRKIKGPILCFAGPPGTGKTSVGQSIAKAMGREFIRISLGGIRDEAEVRGHRRTYVGALPGRIIQGIKSAGTKNPVFMLDEIDKIGADFRGDPSSALLEALDPEQNFAFSDHYIETPFDLSDVMFITTANVLDTIPWALRDRMEIVRFSGYTEEEKERIAKQFLIPKLLKSHGLDKAKIKIQKGVLNQVIGKYTREAGVRGLERELSKILRKIIKNVSKNISKINEVGKISEKNIFKKIFKKIIDIKIKDLPNYLGPAQYSRLLADKKEQVGVVTGLAWTEAGGEILFIEATKMVGSGKLSLTGHLGDIMKESAQAALSYVRSQCKKLKIKNDFFEKTDLHVHVPAGAIPKDGPSAGIAMATAIISCLTGRSVKYGIGMTGEITLRGKVLPIGGVKEKILAAHRAGLKQIILPIENKKDLVKLPNKVKKDLKFYFVKQMDEVLKIALKK